MGSMVDILPVCLDNGGEDSTRLFINLSLIAAYVPGTRGRTDSVSFFFDNGKAAITKICS